jgi:hypothetical protein
MDPQIVLGVLETRNLGLRGWRLRIWDDVLETENLGRGVRDWNFGFQNGLDRLEQWNMLASHQSNQVLVPSLPAVN